MFMFSKKNGNTKKIIKIKIEDYCSIIRPATDDATKRRRLDPLGSVSANVIKIYPTLYWPRKHNWPHHDSPCDYPAFKSDVISLFESKFCFRHTCQP